VFLGFFAGFGEFLFGFFGVVQGFFDFSTKSGAFDFLSHGLGGWQGVFDFFRHDNPFGGV
jgi:hypothetical protein